MNDIVPPPALLADLLKIFTVEQAERLLIRFAEIKAQGYGRVTITFADGRPDIIERTQEEKFAKPTNYKAE